MWNVVSAP